MVMLSATGLQGQTESAQTTIPANDGTLRRLRVPILMYHYVSELPPNADNIRTGLTVSPNLFRQHVEYLKTEGYQPISLYEVYLALAHGYELPSKPVVLTFDDGYIDHLVAATRILAEYGFIGTFFVITGYTDNLAAGYLTWPQVAEMDAAGMEIATHSKTHPDLRGRSYDFLVYEILGSIESIESNVGTRPLTFCYPMGRYDDGTIEILRQAGIRAAVTTAHGATHTTDNLLELSRLRIQNTTGVAGLAALLREK